MAQVPCYLRGGKGDAPRCESRGPGPAPDEEDGVSEGDHLTVTRAQVGFSSALMQILVTVVVLNLFVEYVHTVVIDSFTVSILTAVVLWFVLRVVTRLERRVAGYFRRKEGAIFRVLRYLSVWAILFVSKFVILEVVAVTTAGRATLGQFVEVVAIVLVLIAADHLVRWTYRRLGQDA
jgi:hypothetical protein